MSASQFIVPVDAYPLGDIAGAPRAAYSADAVVFWVTTVLCALCALMFPLAG